MGYPISPEFWNLLVATVPGDPWPVKIRDLCAEGVSLVLDSRIEPGKQLVLELYHIPRRFRCRLPVRVTSTVEFRTTCYLWGAFTRELSEEEAEGLL
jgi:hypothetical protein